MVKNTSSAGARPTAKLDTREFAALARVKPQSVRAALCRTGHYLGLRPVKLSTGKLLWDAECAARVLNGEAAK